MYSKTKSGRSPICRICTRDSSVEDIRAVLLLHSIKLSTAPKYIYDRRFVARKPLVRRTAEEQRASGRARYKANSEAYKDRVRKRRAIKADVEYETIKSAEVFERDGWVCQLCFEAVDETLRWPHGKSKSLDHRIPLTKGGSHTYGNVQLAHLECNIAKGNRLTAV